MMSQDGHPLTTFEALHTLAKRFADGTVNLVILIGAPCLMKTETVRRACQGRPCLHVNAKKSPIDLFRDLYEYRDALVILDDVEPLLDSKDGQVLIRALTETTATKTISWGTRTKVVDGDGTAIPKSFTTKSRVFIVANTWRKDGIFAAIESRGNKFVFSPSWAEVYTEAGTWFHQQEILDYVHANLSQMKSPDVRLLLKAKEMRRLAIPGHNWRDVFDPCMQMDGVDREIIRLLKETHLTQKERVAKFVKGGFGDRATFFRRLRKQKARTDEQIPERVIVQKKSVVLPVQPVRTSSGGADTLSLVLR
jgi:hypothetical protein